MLIINKYVLSMTLMLQFFDFIYLHLAHEPTQRYMCNNIDHRALGKQMQNNDNNNNNNNDDNNISTLLIIFKTGKSAVHMHLLLPGNSSSCVAKLVSPTLLSEHVNTVPTEQEFPWS